MTEVKKILVLFFFSLGLTLKSQTPFLYINQDIGSSQFYKAELLLDSCTEASYFLDSVTYYKALLTLKKGDIKQAKSISMDLKRNYPQFKEVAYVNGLIYFVEGKYQKSISEFNKTIKDNPKHIKAFYNRGQAKGFLEDHWSAIKDLTTCIELAPNFALAYYSRASWYDYLGKKTEAKNDYEQCVKLDSTNFDAYISLASVYSDLRENEKACETINKAINAGSVKAEELKVNFCK